MSATLTAYDDPESGAETEPESQKETDAPVDPDPSNDTSGSDKHEQTSVQPKECEEELSSFDFFCNIVLVILFWGVVSNVVWKVRMNTLDKCLFETIYIAHFMIYPYCTGNAKVNVFLMSIVTIVAQFVVTHGSLSDYKNIEEFLEHNDFEDLFQHQDVVMCVVAYIVAFASSSKLFCAD